MNEFELEVQPREELGKAATRRLRSTGQIPGILYGTGSEPTPISLHANTLRKRMENEAFTSHILSVKLGRKKEQAVLKDLQRDPVTSEITHADLLRVSAKQELTMTVPLHFINEEDSPGVKGGGVVSRLMNELEIRCLPKDLPEFIDVDVSALDIGDVINISEVAMPENVALLHDVSQDENLDHAVVSVHTVVHHDEEPEEGEEGEEEEAAGEEDTE